MLTKTSTIERNQSHPRLMFKVTSMQNPRICVALSIHTFVSTER